MVNPTVAVFHLNLYLGLGIIIRSFHGPEFNQSTGNNFGGRAGIILHRKFLISELSDQDRPDKAAWFIGSQNADFLTLIFQIFSNSSGVRPGILDRFKKDLARWNVFRMNFYAFSWFKFQIDLQTVRFGIARKRDQQTTKKQPLL